MRWILASILFLHQMPSLAIEQAEAPAFDSSFTAVPNSAPFESAPARPTIPAMREESEEEEEPRRPAPPKPILDTRFNLEDEHKFHSWLGKLCLEEAVANEEATQISPAKKGGAYLRTPHNKQGSLILLLENYVAAMKQSEQAIPPPAPNRGPATEHRVWLGSGDWKFSAESKSPAAVSKALRSHLSALKTNFFEFRDLSNLNEKPESREHAQRIIREILAASTCQTRAVEKKYNPNNRF